MESEWRIYRSFWYYSFNFSGNLKLYQNKVKKQSKYNKRHMNQLQCMDLIQILIQTNFKNVATMKLLEIWTLTGVG